MSALTATDNAASGERYRQAFDARWHSADALVEIRRAALNRFLAKGFPTQRDEDWKYTNLRRLEMRTFAPAERSTAALAVDQSRWITSTGIRVVFVNGTYMPGLSMPSPQPPGVTLLTLGQWLSHDADEVAAFLARQDDTRSNALEDLNTAFFEDGVVVNLSDGAHAEQPIYIVHQWNANGQQRMSNPRVVVRAARNSRCMLIEHFLGPNDAEYFTNAVTRIEIEAGAVVTHYRLQQESIRSFHIAQSRVRQHQDSRYESHDIALGAALSRVDISARLEGPGASASLRGLFAPSGSQHLDTHTRIDHVAPHTASEEEYRGIAAGRGRGVFKGKVTVQPGAQRIDARQSSRNLLLSPTAEIDTKPELEIYANDVKCSHGATTGQLDPTSLFYLRSRGLSQDEARALLIRAFAESILSSLRWQPARDYLERELDQRFTLAMQAQP